MSWRWKALSRLVLDFEKGENWLGKLQRIQLEFVIVLCLCSESLQNKVLLWLLAAMKQINVF